VGMTVLPAELRDVQWMGSSEKVSGWRIAQGINFLVFDCGEMRVVGIRCNGLESTLHRSAEALPARELADATWTE
jgi:hypothetical protein